MALYETIILSLFDMAMTLLLIHSIMKNFSTSVIHKVIYVIINSVIIGIVNIFITGDILCHIIITITAYISFVLYLSKNNERDISSNTVIFFIVSLIILIIQLSTITLLNSIIHQPEFSFSSGLISQVIGVIIVLFIAKVIPLSSVHLLVKKKNVFFRIVITTIFVLHYTISMLWYLDSGKILEDIIGMIITILLAIAVNTVLLRDALLSQAYEEKLQVYETYLPIIDDMVEEFRKKQHDYHNHLQTLAVLNERFNRESSVTLNEYIDGYNRENTWNDLLKINNKIIIALFYSKYMYAKEQGIDLIFDIKSFHYQSKYTDYEIVELYGILIDNAIEATYNQESIKNIQITLDKRGGFNFFKIINPYKYVSSEQINQFFEKGYSIKEGENRGIGLYKLKQLLDKRGGTIFFSYDTSLESVIVELKHD